MFSRMSLGQNLKMGLTWAPVNKRSKGRSREIWRRTIEKEKKLLVFRTWREAETVARDRVTWSRR